jgi:signal transduction histidine kinase
MQARLEAVIAEKTLELASTEDSIVAQQKLASVGVLSEGLAHELSLPAERIAARLSAARQTLGDFERWLGSLVDDDDEAVMAEFRPLFRRIDEQQRLATDGNARIQAVVRGLTAATRVGENAAQKISPLMPLSTVVSQCREAHPGLSIRLRLDEAPAISCWPDSLAEAFRQVLDNAVRAVQDSPRRGGQISIEARREDARRELVVRLEDTGIGMPPDVLQRAVDPFFTTRAVGAGTGLGLTMARDIIVHHGGTLSIASTLDEGSCVTIRLPLPA